MDVRMPPGMDGIQTIREIMKRFPDTEVVVITAFSDYSWEDIIAQLGTSDHVLILRKPFDAVSIKQITLAMCTKWELSRQNRMHIATLETQVAERTRELKQLLEEKESYIRTIHDDLEFARVVQHRLLPQQLPSFENVNFTARYVPCGLVGGDFYQAVSLDGTKIAVLIFDVSGHGLAAALVTAVAKSAFDLSLHEGGSPSQILARVNHHIMQSTPDNMFITAFLMIIDRHTGLASFSSAGHVPPLLIRANDGSIEELRSRGTFLGIMKSLRLGDGVVALEDGDQVLLYTDGLVEAMDPDDRLFGRNRLKQLLGQQCGGLTCREMVNVVMSNNEDFLQGEIRTDDVCLLAMQWNKSPFLSVLGEILSHSQLGMASFAQVHAEADIDTVSTRLLRDLDRNGYGDRIIKQMRVALVEIILNAIKHGNKQDIDKQVRIAWHVDNSRVLVAVMDEGEGFDPESVPVPTDPALRDRPDGRGIYIARHYVDKLEYTEEGNCVVVITYRKQERDV
jgi:sigma-B regulation protein RsbU (phosphoserine phosphatase)